MKFGLLLTYHVLLVELTALTGGRGGRGRGKSEQGDTSLRKCTLRIDYWDRDEKPTINAVARVSGSAPAEKRLHSKISGYIRFQQQRHNMPVKITGSVSGLPKGANSALHILTLGRGSRLCNRLGGGHYNPTSSKHGSADSCWRHIGDLDDVTADSQGLAVFTIWDGLVQLRGHHSVIGRSVVLLFGGEDNSGENKTRLACGVIGYEGETNYSVAKFHTPSPDDNPWPVMALIFGIPLLLCGLIYVVRECIGGEKRHFRFEHDTVRLCHQRRVAQTAQRTKTSFRYWLSH